MKLKILVSEDTIGKEVCEIDDTIWRLWQKEMDSRVLDHHGDIYNVEDSNKISWLHIFAILKWLEENGIGDTEFIKQNYKAGKKIMIR